MSTLSRSLRVSPAANAAIDALRQQLEAHPGWVHSTTTSVLIEYLCWFREQERSMGESVGFKGFRPVTRRGRPPGVNVYENFRPANQRKAAGLSRDEARLGPERPSE